MLLPKKIKHFPESVSYSAIAEAVTAFIKEGNIGRNVDPVGFFNQTMEAIAAATVFNNNDGRQFWMLGEKGKVLAYALAHISKDVDNTFCYWVSQAWVDKSLRRSRLVREMWEMLRAEAKKTMCKHIIFPTSRNVKPFLRFLGEGWHEYATLLKEDI